MRIPHPTVKIRAVDRACQAENEIVMKNSSFPGPSVVPFAAFRWAHGRGGSPSIPPEAGRAGRFRADHGQLFGSKIALVVSRGANTVGVAFNDALRFGQLAMPKQDP